MALKCTSSWQFPQDPSRCTLDRMSTKTLPTLQELARRSLLQHETMALAALEDVPVLLLPELLMDAFLGGKCNTLKAIVSAWPLPCLPLGFLCKMRKTLTSAVLPEKTQSTRETRQAVEAVLAGLDEVLTQKGRSRRCKLQVLDMRDLPKHFQSPGPLTLPGACVSAIMASQRLEACAGMELRKPLKVISHLDDRHTISDSVWMGVFEWVQKRKQWIHFCHQRLTLQPLHSSWAVTDVENLTCVQELKVTASNAETLRALAPYVGRMRDLKVLRLRCPVFNGSLHVEAMVQFTAHLSGLNHLQEIYLECRYFQAAQMGQILRCLEVSLVTLSITWCELFASDWEHLLECPSLHHLKHLEIRWVFGLNEYPEPLSLLLEQVAATLTTLNLQECSLRDSHLSAILLALSHCSQLSALSLLGNQFSMALLKDLLGHTATLSHLSLMLYPVPTESYDQSGDVQPERFSHLCAELTDSWNAIRPSGIVLFASTLCRACHHRYLYCLQPYACACSENHVFDPYDWSRRRLLWKPWIQYVLQELDSCLFVACCR
ncbi:PRAME family member 8-like [Ctenodactylus gundi]